MLPNMAPVRRAVIDVGTNSVKLLVADVEGHSVIPVFEESEQTRLGKDFYETHQLRRDAINDTASVVAQFAGVARVRNAISLRVIATSAARDARNKQELLDAIKKLSGLDVEIISGEQEADLVYQGMRSDPNLGGQRLLIIDVGGGSAEFIIGQHEHPEFAQSFPLGSVRLLEHLRPSDPPTPEELARCRNYLRTFFADHVHKIIHPVLSNGRERTRLIGAGGAAAILARMEYALDKYRRHEIEGALITIESVRGWMRKLWSMPLRERQTITGLPRKRADVILTGMAIYETVLEEFGFADLRASTRGLRFAAVLQGNVAAVA
jgi:exopolyphosphatase/guanosine-5'-triphosphate,3'-diphosphate pyrophosphatase